jgi:predicted amidohydrolase YtcJ
LANSELTLYSNAAFFTATSRPWADAMLVAGNRIAYVGGLATARRIAGAGATVRDLDGALVVPGFVDGHAHVCATGRSLTQLDLMTARSLEEIQDRLRAWAAAHADAPRLRLFAWQPAAIPGGRPTRQMLDAVVADRPVYAQSFDFHSVWLNSAALAELGVNAGTTDPPGGAIARDPQTGEPTGYIDETAMQRYVWPTLRGQETDAERDDHLAQALASYRAHGVTTTTDMGLNADDLAAMARAEAAGTLTARIVGHWMMRREPDQAANLAQVEHAAELADRHRSPWLRVTGVKFVVDGTVDGCTAALGKPYADGTLADPIWDLDALAPAVVAADAAGLQVAMHAIGDEAIRIAIDAVEHAVRRNGPRPRRHRIEHLEVVGPGEIARLAALGITASMQPVHADPAIQQYWRAMLGDERVDRGFPWPEMTDAGAALAFGTDSPTAPLIPLRNLFVAATRRSAFDPELAPNVPRYALPLADAVRHATRDAAWSARAGEVGQLRGGMLADFTVIDRNVFELPAEQLLAARVLQTVVDGRSVSRGESTPTTRFG